MLLSVYNKSGEAIAVFYPHEWSRVEVHDDRCLAVYTWKDGKEVIIAMFNTGIWGFYRTVEKNVLTK